MQSFPSETTNLQEGVRISGRLYYELMAAFAREAGKPAPRTMEEAVQFLKNELKGFDTPEAKERRDQAVLNQTLELLGRGKEGN